MKNLIKSNKNVDIELCVTRDGTPTIIMNGFLVDFQNEWDDSENIPAFISEMEDNNIGMGLSIRLWNIKKKHDVTEDMKDMEERSKRNARAFHAYWGNGGGASGKPRTYPYRGNRNIY